MIKDETPLNIRPNLRIFKGLPNLSSYLSVFFILLIFFMIGRNFVQTTGHKVDLAQSAGDLFYADQNLIIEIDRQGNIYFGDSVLKYDPDPEKVIQLKEQLKSRINDTRTGSKAREQLLIRTDRNTPFQLLATIFSVAKELNIDAILETGTEIHTGLDVNMEPEKE